jgi:hypothetical protein
MCFETLTFLVIKINRYRTHRMFDYLKVKSRVVDSNESIVHPQVESHQNKEPCKRGAQYSINIRREKN